MPAGRCSRRPVLWGRQAPRPCERDRFRGQLEARQTAHSYSSARRRQISMKALEREPCALGSGSPSWFLGWRLRFRERLSAEDVFENRGQLLAVALPSVLTHCLGRPFTKPRTKRSVFVQTTDHPYQRRRICRFLENQSVYAVCDDFRNASRCGNKI